LRSSRKAAEWWQKIGDNLKRAVGELIQPNCAGECMPKTANPKSERQRNDQFRKDAQKLIDEGQLDPIDAEALLNLTRNSDEKPS
jgi:hypothetical protein